MKQLYKWMFNFSRKQMEKSAVREKMAEETKYVGSAKMSSLTIGNAVAIDRGSGMSTDPDLNFRMYRAVNGYIMEVRQYDKRTDRSGYNLYLITEEQDLGSEISKIITLESLRT